MKWTRPFTRKCAGGRGRGVKGKDQKGDSQDQRCRPIKGARGTNTATERQIKLRLGREGTGNAFGNFYRLGRQWKKKKKKRKERK